MEITLSPQELRTRRCSDSTIERAVASLRSEGYVLLCNGISPATLRAAASRLEHDLEAQVRSAEHRHGCAQHVYVYGHVQQASPHTLAEACSFELHFNPWALGIVHAASGRRKLVAHHTINTNMPGSRSQPVHADSGHDFARSPPLKQFVCNVTLVPTTLQNGALELWPGRCALCCSPIVRAELRTMRRAVRLSCSWPAWAPSSSHLDDAAAVAEQAAGEKWGGEFPPQLLGPRRAHAPPRRLCAPLGAVLIRDMRLWVSHPAPLFHCDFSGAAHTDA
jgi:hypothetical protein